MGDGLLLLYPHYYARKMLLTLCLYLYTCFFPCNSAPRHSRAICRKNFCSSKYDRNSIVSWWIVGVHSLSTCLRKPMKSYEIRTPTLFADSFRNPFFSILNFINWITMANGYSTAMTGLEQVNHQNWLVVWKINFMFQSLGNNHRHFMDSFVYFSEG